MTRTIALCLLLAAAAWAEDAGGTPARPAYSCKRDDVFRFEYTKAITIRQPDEEGVVSERRTELSAVLILELKTPVLDAAGAFLNAPGTLRFDSPRVTLPSIRFYSALDNEPKVLAEKSRAVARAMEGAIKSARWAVTLHADGALRIESRAPPKLQDWLKETSHAGEWRKKAVEMLPQLIEQDLGLKTPGVDRELLMCFAPEAGAADASANPLHPRRSAPRALSRQGTKVQLGFMRQKPAEPDSRLAIPALVSSSDVRASVTDVTTSQGRAVFDTRVRMSEALDSHFRAMLDTLDEDYTVKLLYTCGSNQLQQEVRVQYRLKRLAPPIAKDSEK